MVIGCIIGTRFALKYQKNKDNIIILSILIGLSGALLAAISFSIVDLIIALMNEGIRGFSLFLAIFIPYILMAIIVGGLIGIVLGIYYSFKSEKPIKKPLIDEEFYESLK